ncbi:FAD/FMN-containing dehydrogenase [Aliiruegeria haliotis]|uniref:FAD/FMN-containing dehydrogenase n=1 Tax=Aliiruegeria haliotis TaxID=1280846 RepID=A0A2T0RVJ2_9RHOB|nr:FAD-binding oxidoreductase [Aliiruegeria haliotis]PRY25073.1 FAD/FMN-containing dehydrogenase [Aliiruegeria haliotis]
MQLTPATPAFEATLRATLPAPVFRPLEPRYLEEPRGKFHGADALVLAPGSVEEVSTIIGRAQGERVAVVPYGGGTGLVCGQVAPDLPRPILLTLERMNGIRALHAADNVIEVEAGAVLAHVQDEAEAAGRLFPLSLASEGTAQIGGLLATNAGGVNVLRYGNARDLCLGIEAVLPDGTVLRGLKRLYKDNTGYDLRHLLCGSEGTLGIITAASLKLSPRPRATGAAVLQVESPKAALSLLEITRQVAAEGVSAFELIHRTGQAFLAEVMPQVRLPFGTLPEWVTLIELGVSAGPPPEELLTEIFEKAAEAGLVSDGVVAQSERQRLAFWEMRESIPVANRLIGAICSHDISVPVSIVPEFIDRAFRLVPDVGPFRINCFGHLGDGNLHFNVYPPKGEARSAYMDRAPEVVRRVHDLVHALGGSFSAEHGVGRLKVGDLEHYGDPGRLAAMRAIKAALDPAGIMNPGAVLTR